MDNDLKLFLWKTGNVVVLAVASDLTQEEFIEGGSNREHQL